MLVIVNPYATTMSDRLKSLVERVERNPKLKARFGPLFFAQSAVKTFLSRYIVRPPRLEVEVGGEKVHGVSAFVQNGSPYTYFQSRPIHVAGESELDSGDFSGAVLTRASAVDMPSVTLRVLSQRLEVARHR